MQGESSYWYKVMSDERSTVPGVLPGSMEVLTRKKNKNVRAVRCTYAVRAVHWTPVIGPYTGVNAKLGERLKYP